MSVSVLSQVLYPMENAYPTTAVDQNNDSFASVLASVTSEDVAETARQLSAYLMASLSADSADETEESSAFQYYDQMMQALLYQTVSQAAAASEAENTSRC